MSLAAAEEFSDDDLEIMSNLGIEIDPQADEDTTSAPSEQASTTQAQTEGATPAEPHDSADKPQGNVNAALRASRRAERRARDESERLRKELEDLRAKVPTETHATDDDLDTLEDEFPAAAAALKREREARAAAERRAQELEARANPPKDPDFVPETFPAAVQDAIDDVAELSDWHNDPDQTRFALAKSVDLMLTNHPKWAGKTLQERFAEAVRRVKADLDDEPSPQQDTTEAAKARLKSLKRSAPETLSDLGGSTPANNVSNVERFARMTEDQILDELARGG